MNKKTVAMLFVLIISALLFTGCTEVKISQVANDNTTGVSTSNDKSVKNRTVTDSSGRQVQIPLKVERVADTWMGHNEVLAMLGADDRIVATMFSPETRPWAYKVCPAYYNAVTLGPTYNVEALLATKPDVVFMPKSDKNIEKVSNLGAPVIQVSFTDFDSMKKCFSDTANVLGDEEALERSQKYNAYLDSKLESVKIFHPKYPMKKDKKYSISYHSHLCV